MDEDVSVNLDSKTWCDATVGETAGFLLNSQAVRRFKTREEVVNIFQ